ncbi:MAG: alpha-amylase [Desulfurococcaceae archaeon]
MIFFFEVHQPYRLDRRAYEKVIARALRGRLEPNDVEEAILDNGLNREVLERASRKCYLPANAILLEGISKDYDGKRFKVSFSISGTLLEQASRWMPELIDSFAKLASSENVELVEQTFYHSIASLLPIPDQAELVEQIGEHRKIVKELFGRLPTAVENTEFMYNNDVALLFERMGYRVILTEGVDWVLGWRSPNYVYRSLLGEARVLTRNYRLSDDVGFRFSDRKWDQYPLTADKYASWLAATPGDVILIAVDYETFGEHHWPESGIHEFLRWLPIEVLKHPHLSCATATEAAARNPPRDVYDVPPWRTISWADERDVSAWAGNPLQANALRALYDLYWYVRALDDPRYTRLWKLLTTSDHFYYMATKFGSIAEVHTYFSPYKNASEAYAIFQQALGILSHAIAEAASARRHSFYRRLRVPADRAFHFTYLDGRYTGISASSVPEFLEALERVPPESLVYHLNRGDIAAWFEYVMAAPDVSEELRALSRERPSADEAREKIAAVVKRLIE